MYLLNDYRLKSTKNNKIVWTFKSCWTFPHLTYLIASELCHSRYRKILQISLKIGLSLVTCHPPWSQCSKFLDPFPISRTLLDLFNVYVRLLDLFNISKRSLNPFSIYVRLLGPFNISVRLLDLFNMFVRLMDLFGISVSVIFLSDITYKIALSLQ